MGSCGQWPGWSSHEHRDGVRGGGLKRTTEGGSGVWNMGQGCGVGGAMGDMVSVASVYGGRGTATSLHGGRGTTVDPR